MQGQAPTGAGALGILLSTSTDSIPFYIRNAGTIGAPRITALNSGGGGAGLAAAQAVALAASPQVPVVTRGPTPVPVVLEGVNFDATATVLSEDPHVGVSDVSFDSADGTVHATLTVPETVPTGIHYLSIQTAAGRSDVVSYTVRGSGAAPALGGPYPNYVVAGRASEVAFSGGSFTTGTEVVVAPGAQVTAGAPRIVDRLGLKTNLVVEPAVFAPATGSANVLTVGGASNAVPLLLKPAGFKGPRITNVTPSKLITGAVDSQILITGQNFDTSPPTALFNLPNETVGFFIIRNNTLNLLAPSVVHPTCVVAKVNTDGSGIRPGRFDVVLTTADGLRTNAFPIEMIAPPPSPRPYISRATIQGGGTLVRGGGARAVTIFGGGLTGARAIRTHHRGLSATITGVSDFAVSAQFTADGTVPISGDTPTFFEVFTPRGASTSGSIHVTAGP